MPATKPTTVNTSANPTYTHASKLVTAHLFDNLADSDRYSDAGVDNGSATDRADAGYLDTWTSVTPTGDFAYHRLGVNQGDTCIFQGDSGTGGGGDSYDIYALEFLFRLNDSSNPTSGTFYTNGGNYYLFGEWITGGNIRFWLRQYEGGATSVDATIPTAGDDVHIVVNITSTTAFEVWVNGTSQGTGACSAGTAAAFGYGDWNTSGADMDQWYFAHYDDTLTSTEIGLIFDEPYGAVGASLTSDQTLTVPALTNAKTLYTPTIVASQTLSLPALANAKTLHEPTVEPGQVDLSLPALSNVSTLHEPSVVPGDVQLGLPALSNVATFHEPTVVPGDVTLGLPTLANAKTLHEPTVEPGAATLSLPAFSNVATFHPPTVEPGQVDLALPSLVNASTLFAPTVAPDQTLALPAFSGSSQVFAPDALVPGAASLALPHLSSSRDIFPPSLEVGDVTIGPLPLVQSEFEIFPPSLVLNLEATVTPAAASSIHAPTVTPGQVDLEPPTLVNAKTLHAPTIFLGEVLGLPALVNLKTIHEPTELVPGDISIELPHFNGGGGTIHPPIVGDFVPDEPGGPAPGPKDRSDPYVWRRRRRQREEAENRVRELWDAYLGRTDEPIPEQFSSEDVPEIAAAVDDRLDELLSLQQQLAEAAASASETAAELAETRQQLNKLVDIAAQRQKKMGQLQAAIAVAYLMVL